MLWPWPWKNGWAPELLIRKLVLEASLQIQKQILLNPSSPFSSLGVSTPLTGSDFSSVVAVSWAWSDEAMPELPDFPKRSGDTAEVRKLRLMKPVQDATWGTPWWRVDELAAHLLRREDRKWESIVFCRWDVFECVWTENGGARKHRICGVFWNALSRAVACFMLLMAFWCPPSNNLHKLPQCFITSFSESHQHLRADTRKFTKSTWVKTLKPWPRPPDQYQFSNMGMGGERQGWRLEPDEPETEPLNPEPWPRWTWDKTLNPNSDHLISTRFWRWTWEEKDRGGGQNQINLRQNP
jgi:hypothetical protein